MTNNSVGWRLGMVLVLLAVAAGSGAQETQVELEEMVVSASRVQERIKDTSATVNALSAGQLDDVKFRNPQEILARIPGLYSHNFGNESELTSIRVPTHFTNPYTLVLLDGVPIAGYGSGSSGQFADIDSRTIARVEVVKGPSSALYGSNAIGGVINLITRRPWDRARTDFSLEAGQDGRWRGWGAASLGDEGLGGSLDLSYQDNEGWRQHNRFEKRSGRFQVFRTTGAEGELVFKLDYVDREGQTAGSLAQAEFSADWRQSYHTFAFANTERYAPTLSWRGGVGAGRVSATLGYRDVRDETIADYSIRQQGPTYVGSRNQSRDRAGNFQLVYHRFFDFLDTRLVAGLDAETGSDAADTWDLSVQRDADTRLYTGYTTIGLGKSYDIDTRVAAPYLQWEGRLREGLKLNVGGRFDSTTYDVRDKLTDTAATSEFSQVTPKVGAVYDFSPAINSYLSFSQGFVVPTTSQLLTSSWANSDLDPEHADNWELGVRTARRDGRLRLEVAVYRMEIRDKIITRNVSAWVKQYANAGRTRQKGLEVVGAWVPVEGLDLALAYTRADNKFQEYADGTVDYAGNVMPRSPDHRVNLRAAVKPASGWRMELEMDAVSAVFADDANLYRYKRPPLLNLRASWRRGDWSVWGHVLNLADRKYASYVSDSTAEGMTFYPGAPLTLYAGLSHAWGR